MLFVQAAKDQCLDIVDRVKEVRVIREKVTKKLYSMLDAPNKKKCQQAFIYGETFKILSIGL